MFHRVLYKTAMSKQSQSFRRMTKPGEFLLKRTEVLCMYVVHFINETYDCKLRCNSCKACVHITSTVVGVYRDWPGSSALNLYI